MALVNVEVTAKDETVRGSRDAIRKVKGGAILIRVVATGADLYRRL